MIVVTGCPKSGTHAVMALLDTMGLRRHPGTILPLNAEQLYVEAMPVVSTSALKAVPNNCYILAHVPAQYDLGGFTVMTVFRDPRNVLVSYCRRRFRDGIVLSIAQALRDFWGQHFVSVYAAYLGWRGRSIVFRYEDLPPSMVGNGAGIYRDHGVDHNTRTGRPSRWEDHWDALAEAAWIEHGGPELLLQAGYGDAVIVRSNVR